jgi:hypothetical protein
MDIQADSNVISRTEIKLREMHKEIGRHTDVQADSNVIS